MNPGATAAAGVGFGGKVGTIQYASIQDIESGQVTLPFQNNHPSPNNNSQKSKGFKPQDSSEK